MSFNFDRRFFGAYQKQEGHFWKKTFVYIFRILKNLISFNFDRRFFGASQKMDGHFSEKLIC